MWCSSCQSEVAAKVSTDNNRLFCASCGKELDMGVHTHGLEKTREAQDLLKRWSSENQEELVPAGRQEIHEPAHSSVPPENHAASWEEEKPFIDQKISEAIYSSQNHQRENFTQTYPANEKKSESVNFSQKSPVQSPSISTTVDIQSTITRDKPQNTNWVGFFGQLLSYGGVALLTVGTCMVLLGYFGGKEGYAPQGWLISTVGQMALLLGIVTLVSCGIETSSNEITNHITSLDERILRIEQAALANYSSQVSSRNSSDQDNSHKKAA